MNASKNLYRDIMTGLFLFSGILSFISGQYIMSTLLFGAASVCSNLNLAIPARI